MSTQPDPPDDDALLTEAETLTCTCWARGTGTHHESRCIVTRLAARVRALGQERDTAQGNAEFIAEQLVTQVERLAADRDALAAQVETLIAARDTARQEAANAWKMLNGSVDDAMECTGSIVQQNVTLTAHTGRLEEQVKSDHAADAWVSIEEGSSSYGIRCKRCKEVWPCAVRRRLGLTEET